MLTVYWLKGNSAFGEYVNNIWFDSTVFLMFLDYIQSFYFFVVCFILHFCLTVSCFMFQGVEVSLLTLYWNSTPRFVIETINKFLNLTGYCRPDLSDTKTVYAPCSKLDSVLGECMRHACVIRQCASFNGAHAFVLHFSELTVDFLFMKTCYQWLIYIFVFLRVVIGK